MDPALPMARTRPFHSACHGHDAPVVPVVIAVPTARVVAGKDNVEPNMKPSPSVGVAVVENSPSASRWISTPTSSDPPGITGAGVVVLTRICWKVVNVLNAGPLATCRYGTCETQYWRAIGYPSLSVGYTASPQSSGVVSRVSVPTVGSPAPAQPV